MTVSRNKTAKSLFWSVIENGGLMVISFATLIVYSRLLSPDDFGLFSIVFAFIELVGIVVSMLFHDALVQRKDVTDLHFDTAFTVTMVGSLFLVLGCALLAPVFAMTVHQPRAASILTCISLVFPCTAAGVTLVARQRRQFAFRALALRSLVGRIVGGVAGIVAALMGAGLWSLVLQQILMASIGSIVLWLTCDRAPRLRFGYKEFRQLMAFGVFAVGGLFLSFSIKRLFTILAGFLLGLELAGYLNISFRVIDMLWILAATAVVQVALPMLSGLQSDPERLKRAYQKAVEFSCFVLYPCFVGLAVTAPDIVELIFGRRWLPSAPYMTILGFLVLIQVPRLFVTPVLAAVGRPRDPLVGLIFELVFMLSAIGLFGLHSLPWAIGVWVASESTQLPVSGWILKRATGYSFADQLRCVPVSLAAALAMAATVLVTRHLLPGDLGPFSRLLVSVAVGGVTFLGVAFLLDRRVIDDFIDFVRRALEKKARTGEPPQAV